MLVNPMSPTCETDVVACQRCSKANDPRRCRVLGRLAKTTHGRRQTAQGRSLLNGKGNRLGHQPRLRVQWYRGIQPALRPRATT